MSANPNAFMLPADNRDESIDRLVAMLRRMFPGNKVEITARKYRKPRSDAQNNSLWGVAYKVLREASGNDPDDLHVYFCGEYFGWVEYDVMGAKKKRPRRTTTTDENGHANKMSTVEFMDFYEFIQRRSAEAGYLVPDPDPLWFTKE